LPRLSREHPRINAHSKFQHDVVVVVIVVVAVVVRRARQLCIAAAPRASANPPPPESPAQPQPRVGATRVHALRVTQKQNSDRHATHTRTLLSQSHIQEIGSKIKNVQGHAIYSVTMTPGACANTHCTPTAFPLACSSRHHCSCRPALQQNAVTMAHIPFRCASKQNGRKSCCNL